ncbi:MAG: flagellar biosynthesis protein FlhB [Treponema sp.]|jgi:flagellar biosynthetic protein FlhB|nr:flagellar biosynthesis protein FlhB [Treponema sp.]
MDLQWFAAEDEGRTEEATDEKIRRAREDEGRVAKSQELISALVLLLPALVLLFIAPFMLRTCVEMLRFFFFRCTELDPVKDRSIVAVSLIYYVKLALPLLAMGFIAGVFSNFVQVGVLFTVKPLTPKFDRILPNFGRYFGRIFSVDGAFNLLKSVVKMAIIGVVAFFLIRSKIEVLVNLQTASLWTGVSTVASLAIRLLIIAALMLLALSIPDYMFQRWQYMQSLKMTKEEVKEEHKQYEGDPLVKSRLRARMRELLTQNMAVNVPKADVVVTNPTHFAVALEYHTTGSPQVTAKGEDEMALLIKRIARESGVPVVENKPLARALYAETKVGDEVPAKYWQVVADVLAKVMHINEERRKRGAAR